MSLADFDAYREEHGVSLDDEEAVAALFAEWLSQTTGASGIYRIVEEHEEATGRFQPPDER